MNIPECIARARAISIQDCLSRSVDLFKSQFAMVFAATILVWIASMSIGAVPFVGVFLTGAIHGVLYGGLYAFFLKLIRRQKAEIPDAFSGFSRDFPQLLLGGGVTSLLTMLAIGLIAAPFLIAIVPTVMLFARDPHTNLPVLPIALAILAVVAALAVGLFLTTMWVFTVPLIIDRKLEFWPAMEMSRQVALPAFSRIAGLLLAAGFVALAGVLFCGVGMLFTMPIAFGAVVYAYEQIFGPGS